MSNTGIKVEPIVYDGVRVGTKITSAEYREFIQKLYVKELEARVRFLEEDYVRVMADRESIRNVVRRLSMGDPLSMGTSVDLHLYRIAEKLGLITPNQDKSLGLVP